MYIICEVVSIFVLGIVNLDNLINTDEDVCDSHLVHGEGTSLVWADVVGTSHDLARGKLLYEVLVNKHLSHGVGKCDHDCKGKTFGYGHDYNCDGNDQVLKPLYEVFFEIVLFNFEKWVFSKEIHATIGELLNKESKKKHMEGQECCEHTKSTKILTDFV